MAKILLTLQSLSYFLRYACGAWYSAEPGQWGDWLSKVNQPDGYLACGMAVRNDPYDPCGTCDNTALNAVKMIWCRMDNWDIQQSSLLNDGWYGTWLSDVKCAKGYFMYGVRVKLLLWARNQDDVAITAIEMKCRHSTSNASSTIMVFDSPLGHWNIWVESPWEYICGGQVKYEHLTKADGDATALNGLQVNFCYYKCSSTVTNCSKCNVDNPCIECNLGFYLYHSSGSISCVNPCPLGFRSDQSSNSPSCIACEISNCAVCTSSIDCKSCKPGYFLDNSTLNEYCVTICPSGYTTDSYTQFCKACNITNCQDCSSDVNTCNSCKVDYFLDTSTQNTLCVSTCPSGYRRDSAALPQRCIACSVIYCDTCPYDNTCLVCKANYFLHVIESTYTCENPCPSGFRGDISLSPSACVSCSVENCDICSTSSNCLKCLDGYFLLMIGEITSCEQVCTRGYRVDTVSYPPSCKLCEVQYCDICDTSGRCIECKHNYYLHAEDIITTCEIVCPSGFREDSSSVPNSCTRCEVPNCNECSETSRCSECKTEFFLYIKDDTISCEVACPSGYREDISSPPFSCILCDVSNCEICDSSKCLECKDNYFLYTFNDATTCEETCPIRYGSDTSLRPYICKSCAASNCKRCGSYDVCNECEDGYNLIFLDDTYICLDTCPNGYASVQDLNIQTCKKCQVSKCQICNELSECDRCEEGYYLIKINGNFICINNCDGTGDEYCTPCTIKFCKRCYQDICIECSSPTLLNDESICICPSENYHIVDKACIPRPFSASISSPKESNLEINFSVPPANSIISSDYTIEYTMPGLSSLLLPSLFKISDTIYSITFISPHRLDINSSLTITFKDSVKDAISQSLILNKLFTELRFYSSSDCISLAQIRDCNNCSISNESLKSCNMCDSSCRCISASWLTCSEIVPMIEAAIWNSDMLSFTIRFNIQIKAASLLSNGCSNYFTSNSLSQLGISPICTLSDLRILTVIIGTDCSLTIDSNLSLSNQISSAYNQNKSYDNTNGESITAPSQYPSPTAVLTIPSIITYCNGLKGDGSQSFGNRRKLRYDWSVSGNNSEIISNINNILITESGSTVTISSELLKDLREITITLNVTNVFGISHSTTATVIITEDFVPEVIFQAGSEIQILTTATYSPQITLKWPVCKPPPISYSTEWYLTPISEGQIFHNRRLESSSNNKQSYTIAPGILKADNSYKLTVTVIPNTVSNDALSASMSQVITALPAPMFVAITRGDRLASIYKNAILDGSLSSDASYPDLDLSYSWSCEESNIECDFMKNLNSITSQELFIPTNTMKPDKTYIFRLIVSNSKRSSSTSAYLKTLSSTTIPEVYLLTYESAHSTKYINYLNPNYIVLASNEISEFKDLKLQWRIIGGEYDLNSPSNQRSISIREGTLKYGIFYTFTLEVTYEDYFATSSITLYVNTPPIRGSLNISPSEGNELETYTFITSGWEDVENNYPIRYELYKDVDDLLVKIIDLNYATIYEGVLSAGSENYGYSTDYYIKAYDSLGAYSHAYSSVIVKPISQDDAESLAFSKIENLSQNKEVIESLDSIPYTVITLSDSLYRFGTNQTSQYSRQNFVQDCVDLLSFYSEIDIESTRQAASVISTLERLTTQPQVVNDYSRSEALRMLGTSISQNEGNFKPNSVKQSVEIATNLYLSGEKDSTVSSSTNKTNSISYYSLLNNLGLAVVKNNIRNQEILEISTDVYKVLYQRVSPSAINSNFTLQDSQIIFPSSILEALKSRGLSSNSVIDLSFIYSQQNSFTNYSSSFDQSLYYIKNAGVMYVDIKSSGYENSKGGIEFQQSETIELNDLRSPIEIYITVEYINITDQTPECVYLNEDSMKWENTGCRFKEYLEDSSQIVCECFHMSYYSVADFKTDLKQAGEKNRAQFMNPEGLIEAKFEDVYSVMIVMCIILLIHIATSVFAYIMDREDRNTPIEFIPENEKSPKSLKSVYPVQTEGLYMVYQEVEMQRKTFSQLFVLKHKLLELRYIRNHSLSKLSRLSLLFYSIYANIFVLGFFYSIKDSMNFEDHFKQMATAMEFEIQDVILFIYTKLVVLAPLIILKWLLARNISTFKRSVKNWIGIVLIAIGYIGSILGIILLGINFRVRNM